MVELGSLKRCPFCGGEAALSVSARDDRYNPPRPCRLYAIECSRCEAKIERLSSDWWGGGTPPPETKEDRATLQEVVAAWNNRSSE